MAADTSNDSKLPAVRDAARPNLLTWAFGLDKPALTSRPQRWGIVPTLRFWNRIDTFKYQAPALVAGIGLAYVVVSTLLAALTPILGYAAAWTIAVTLASIAACLPLGLFERWLRKRISQQRGPDDAT